MDEYIKEAKELMKQKENEITWIKIYNLLTNLQKELNTLDKIQLYYNNFHELLYISVQSERSRLNGLSLDLLKSLVEISKKN